MSPACHPESDEGSRFGLSRPLVIPAKAGAPGSAMAGIQRAGSSENPPLKDNLRDSRPQLPLPVPAIAETMTRATTFLQSSTYSVILCRSDRDHFSGNQELAPRAVSG